MNRRESDEYLTLKGEVNSLLKEKGSKFIGHAAGVASEEIAVKYLDKIKKRYHDATHNCYAYRIRKDDSLIERCGDDGEPAGSAGKPMLDVLTGRGLENVLVVVTRYFGGTKLGVGGLVRAYSGCVRMLLDDAAILRESVKEEVLCRIGYKLLNPVLRVAASYGCSDMTQNHTEDGVEVVFKVRRSDSDRFRNDLVDATGARISFQSPD